MGYYLQDNPNPNFGQFGWPRAKLGQPGTKLSGVIGVHTTEAITDFEGVDNNAENNAAFVGRRPDPGGYHTTADADSIVHLVHPRYAAWADTTNNAHALSVSGALQAARWLEMTPARRAAVVMNMAYAIAEIVTTAVDEGYLAAPTPARRITPAEAVAGSKAGFYGHGETNPGRRYDPGQNFDWGLFLTTYAAAVSGGLASMGGTITPLSEEDELNEAQDGALGVVFQSVNKAPAAGMIASQGDINIVLSALGNLSARVDALAASAGAQPPEPTTTLVKGDGEPTVYAWDGATGYRALGYDEFAALMSTGAQLITQEQATINKATGKSNE